MSKKRITPQLLLPTTDAEPSSSFEMVKPSYNSFQEKRLKEAINRIEEREKAKAQILKKMRRTGHLIDFETGERVFDNRQIPAIMEPTDFSKDIVPQVKRTKNMKNVKRAMPKQRLTRKQKLESGMWYEGLTKSGKRRLMKKSKRDIERSKKLKCGVYTQSATGRLKQKTKKELVDLVNDYCGQIEMLTGLM